MLERHVLVRAAWSESRASAGQAAAPGSASAPLGSWCPGEIYDRAFIAAGLLYE